MYPVNINKKYFVRDLTPFPLIKLKLVTCSQIEYLMRNYEYSIFLSYAGIPNFF